MTEHEGTTGPASYIRSDFSPVTRIKTLIIGQEQTFCYTAETSLFTLLSAKPIKYTVTDLLPEQKKFISEKMTGKYEKKFSTFIYCFKMRFCFNIQTLTRLRKRQVTHFQNH
jgi:hypothetical protein